MKNIFKTILLSSVLVVAMTSCSDFLDPEQTNYATSEQIDALSKSNPEALVTITDGMISGMYASLGDYQTNHDTFSLMSIGLAADLSNVDMVQMVNHWFFYDYQMDNRNYNYRRPSATWNCCYTLINKANDVINLIADDVTNESLKANLGQALAMRAFGHWLAINRFQQTYIDHENDPGVPIYVSPREGVSKSGRNTVQEVYDQINSDFEASITLLEGYTRANKGVVNKQVVEGLAARSYMMQANYTKAAAYAADALTTGTLESATALAADEFDDITSSEWMWGRDVTSETTNMFASFQSHISTVSAGYAGGVGVYKAIDKRLYESMDVNDPRLSQFQIFTSYGDPYMYVNNKFGDAGSWLSDNPYMRVSEMYLIAVEAYLRDGNTSAATSLYNTYIAQRGGASVYPMSLDEVFHQKRLELWGEGQILYDYLRLKKVIDRTYAGSNHLVKLLVQPGSWRLIYDIPKSEIEANTDITLDDRNPDYTD
ncbi:MAG: RagB/SusD family nutrient uptake outer membrane protein [Bacteroidales bacterium]